MNVVERLDVTVEPRATASTPQRYGERTAADGALRENRGWDVIDLDATPGEEFDRVFAGRG